MEVNVNWLAVLLAGLSSIIVGSIFYAKPVFGNTWAKLAKVDAKKMSNAGRSMAIAAVMSLVMAFVIAHVAAISRPFYEVSALSAALTTAFWLWLGVSLTTVFIHDIFEHRPVLLTYLTVAYQFFAMMAMGLIVGLFGGF
ncbi:MAG TPA: DUF1761 domain-containing protein [Candidatus Saccharimonadales bacterium]|nr:DUF1761 domain-containing protein [Candidatus Saccharimonadales bacterium]